MLYTIIAIAVVAFLFVLCYIYRDNLKDKIKNIFKKPKKKEAPKKEEKKPEIKNEDFIPLQNQYDDFERDESLQDLLSGYESYDDNDILINDDGEKLFVGDVFEQPMQNHVPLSNTDMYSNDLDFDKMFAKQFGSQKKSNKPIAQQIKDLSPELKAILVDSLLKKRDDV